VPVPVVKPAQNKYKKSPEEKHTQKTQHKGNRKVIFIKASA